MFYRLRRAAESVFDEIRGVWIADKTLPRVFDISCKSKQKLKSKRRSKIVKIYANQERVFKRPSLDELLMSLTRLLKRTS